MKNSLRLSSNEKKLHNDRCIIFLIFYWVNEWVIVFFIAKSALLQLYQDQSKFSMRSWWGPFCTRPICLVYFFVVLAGWNNSPRIDMSPPLGHIIQIPSQPVFALSAYGCVLSGEATHTNVIVFGCTRSGIEPTIYRTQSEHIYHYITDSVICFIEI
jgi:hypothetical protein